MRNRGWGAQIYANGEGERGFAQSGSGSADLRNGGRGAQIGAIGEGGRRFVQSGSRGADLRNLKGGRRFARSGRECVDLRSKELSLSRHYSHTETVAWQKWQLADGIASVEMVSQWEWRCSCHNALGRKTAPPSPLPSAEMISQLVISQRGYFPSGDGFPVGI